MNIPIVSKWLSGLALAAVLLGSGFAQAALCTVTGVGTNPDGSLADATDCGLATPIPGGQSPAATQAGLNAVNPGGLGLTWFFVDRDPGSAGAEIDSAFAMTGSTSGTWLINKDDIPGFTNFVVTMKDGDPLSQDFLWFLIDTSVGANGCSGAQIGAGWDLCGTWSMYGKDGNAQSVSHMDLFVAEEDIIIPPFQIPAPSAPLLLGIGLLGLWLTRRRSIA